MQITLWNKTLCCCEEIKKEIVSQQQQLQQSELFGGINHTNINHNMSMLL